jgi:hypothetical protein
MLRHFRAGCLFFGGIRGVAPAYHLVRRWRWGAGRERRCGVARWGAVSEGYVASLQDAGDWFWGYLGVSRSGMRCPLWGI